MLIMTQEEYIKQLENTITSLQNQISNLTEMVTLLTKQKFGSSSEKTPTKEMEGQLSLFNEAEVEAEVESDLNVEDPAHTMVKDHTRSRKQKGHKEELLKDLEVVEITCELHEDDKHCGWCKSELKPIGKEVIREELQFIPASMKVLRYVRYAYECPTCRKDGTPVIEKAYVPTPVMKHSLASASTVAHVMYQKYVNALPLYRQEKDLEQYGVKIGRATLANWIIRCSTDWFLPVIAHMKQTLLKSTVLHADETTVQVLREEHKKATTDSYMWLYRTGECEKHPIVLFDYQASRGGKHAGEYLKAFQGYLHTDGYAGYEKVDGITRCGCWSHLRRYFVEAMPPGSEKALQLSNGEIGRDYCNQLFSMEKQFTLLNPELRKQQRLEQETPVLEAFWSWVTSLNPLKGSKLAKAVTYAKNQRTYLENYLLDGRCALSNNLAENSIRPFTIGRKNWLFSTSPKGATASAATYSIVETAKANNLDVYKYLQYLLSYMPDTDYKNSPEELEELMPWSKEMQRLCKR